jgi:hypothetical protein
VHGEGFVFANPGPSQEKIKNGGLPLDFFSGSALGSKITIADTKKMSSLNMTLVISKLAIFYFFVSYFYDIKIKQSLL